MGVISSGVEVMMGTASGRAQTARPLPDRAGWYKTQGSGSDGFCIGRQSPASVRTPTVIGFPAQEEEVSRRTGKPVAWALHSVTKT